MKKQTKSCATCGKVFEKKINCSKKEWAKANFCSRTCINVGRTSWNKNIPMPEEQKEHLRKILQGRCCNTGRTHIKKGQHLSNGTEFKKGMVGTWKGKKLSEEHRSKIKESKLQHPTKTQFQKGEKHPNWKGGVTPENRRARKTIQFRSWREEVFTRDNFICQKCKTRGGDLHPHHIEDFADNIELRYVVSNGITLHEKCHKEFHKIYGHADNNREQIQSFLSTI